MKPVLTLTDAKRIAAAAEAEAQRHNWRVVIAVVDDGGHLIYLQRSHETQFGSVETAIAKAYAAIAFQRPTKSSEDAVMSGRLIHWLCLVPRGWRTVTDRWGRGRRIRHQRHPPPKSLIAAAGQAAL
jgi:uncharacterized protein GlcG (DUF336 family)